LENGLSIDNINIQKLYRMKLLKITSTFLFIVLCQIGSGQTPVAGWEKWNILIGEWVGEGSGQPGQNGGKFSFQTDLDGKILVRKSHTVFPASANSVEKTHDDLLIIYQGSGDSTQEAIYFDNEGHTIKYKISFTDKSIVFTSDIDVNAPRFRLTYTTIDIKTVNISFEMASPESPNDFKMYLSGKANKTR
jgi:hypothetical protein